MIPRICSIICLFVVLDVFGGNARADVFEIGPAGELVSLAGSLRMAPETANISHPEPLRAAADAVGLSADLVAAVAWCESRFKPRIVSSAGAIGEMQIMPATAKALGIDAFDTRQNYAGGSRYLAMMLQRYNNNVTLALAAYNAGPGAVDKYGGVPPYRETHAYVAAVLARLATISSSSAFGDLNP